jgi:hypothetical protein
MVTSGVEVFARADGRPGGGAAFAGHPACQPADVPFNSPKPQGMEFFGGFSEGVQIA